MRSAAACSLLILFFSTSSATAADMSPSYSKHVQLFFARYCLECHSGDQPKGDLNLETYKGVRAGGASGEVVVAGKPDESTLVLQAEGKKKPTMPPKKAKQPKPEEVAILRAWVAAGAKDDALRPIARIPDIKPRAFVSAPIAALSYHPSGKTLVAGSYKEALAIDGASGAVVASLSGQAGPITAVAFRPDGRSLALAAFVPGTRGELRLYDVNAAGIPNEKPRITIAAHDDSILQIAWSRDGISLATCSYDRLVKLWDPATGQLRRTLKDHSDAVYGISFSPDGKLLASGGADRAVKVWDVANGKRLYTLGESTDWVYAVAWSPDGKHLAAAGVDKSIRVWEAGHTGGKIVHSVFAHEAAITRLTYSPDGKTLYSLAEDSVKAWDTARMTERKVFPKQSEVALALALRPDARELAIGRYDGHVVLLDEATGKVQAEPLPAKPKPPQITTLSPGFARRGQTVHVTFHGKHLDGVTDLTGSHAGVTGKILSSSPTKLEAVVTIGGQVPANVYHITLKNSIGTSAPRSFAVDLFDAVSEREPNDAPVSGQAISLPTTILGSAGRPGDVDYYRFDASAGQEIGVQVIAMPTGTKWDPVLQLTDAAGQVLAESGSGLLGYRCPKAGTYTLGIRDAEYRGSDKMTYRLHVGPIPIVTSIFPLGVRAGTEAAIELDGVNLGVQRAVRLPAPANAKPGTRIAVPVATPLGLALGQRSVVVGEFPEIDRAGRVPVPGTGNGRIARPGATDSWRFTASKGQRLIVEINARRLGSPLDSVIEILDAHTGVPVPRAVLRCLAKTYTTFRDHDSSSSGIRIETWSELAVNDYLLVGDELVRIRALPRNPDDDCQFFSRQGKRVGFLGTTPTHHSLGTPMYKVAIHPPGTVFPPNGLPVVTLNYRNDDGGPGFGKDSFLIFDPPAGGDYLVRVSDARGDGGPAYAYRLTVRPPRPDFAVRFDPSTPTVTKGGAVPMTIRVDRIDGFDGPVDARLDNLPPGFSAPSTHVGAGEETTALALWADSSATNASKSTPLKLIARAQVNGHEIVHEFVGGSPKVVDPGDIVTSTRDSAVTIRPGGQVSITAQIQRRAGFKGRVPLDVTGLPHGVRVLDVGLNGILITDAESRRTFVLYAEPWVKPQEHPIVVLARREGKPAQYAAKSVLLRVAGN